MKNRSDTIMRWLMVASTAGACFLLFLLQYRFPEYLIGFPHRQAFHILILSMGGLTLVSCWIAIDQHRFRRFRKNIFHPFPVSLLVILFTLPALLDIFFPDVLFYSFLLPLPVGGILVWCGQDKSFEKRIRPKLLGSVQKTALVIGGVFFSLIFAEIIFRVFLIENLVPNTREKFEQLVVSDWPKPLTQKKDKNVIRIIGLSDSFGEFGGAGNYHYQLENLAQDAGLPVDVVNFSTGGYAPVDELTLLKRFGADYQPDLVLHGFYVGNDFHAPRHLLVSFQQLDFRLEDTYIPLLRDFLIVQWLRRVKLILRYELNSLRQQKQAKSPPPGSGPPGEPATATGNTQSRTAEAGNPGKTTAEPTNTFFTQEEFLQIERNNLEICRLKPSPEDFWYNTTMLLDQIRKEAEQMGSEYMMVIHPARIQVEQKVLTQVRERYNIDMDQYDLNLPQKFLLKYCRQRNLKCLDLLPIFLKERDKKDFFRPRDLHYNGNGNQLAAEVLFDFLQDKNSLNSDRQ